VSVEANELIPEYLLGSLPRDEQRELEALMATSPGFRREVDACAEALAASAGALTPVPPSAALRGRLLDTLGATDRFAPFFADLVELFELPLETIKRLLARIDGVVKPANAWETTLMGVALKGAELFHFGVGPRLAASGAAGGIVRIHPDVTFPMHSHNGSEVTYVLEGGYCADGRVYGPGSRIEVTGDVVHDYRSAPGRDLVIAVLHRGVVMIPTT
jgi:quercetin dioxygenase-like cupin family protein